MDVFDSNIWIYGLTRTCEPTVELVDQAVRTPVHVGVSAYIFDEVMVNLQRSAQPPKVINQAQTRFADLVYGRHTINGPTQAEIEQMDLERQRRDPRVQAMSEAFGIQEKDAPIVVYAHQCARTGTQSRPRSIQAVVQKSSHTLYCRISILSDGGFYAKVAQRSPESPLYLSDQR